MKKLALLSAAVACSLTQMAQAKVALDPQAFNLEPFRLIPTLEVQAFQDSNIYKLSADEKSSFVTVLRPAFDLVTQDRDNVYRARYAAAAGIYAEGDNDYVDHSFSLNAHVEPTSRFRFDARAGYNFLHDDLGTAYTEGLSVAALEARGGPDQYNLATLGGGVEYGAKDAAGQVALQLNYGQKSYDQADVAVERDLDMLDGQIEFRLRIMPKTKALLDLEYEKGTYDNAATAAKYDYDGTAYFLGVMWENSASTTGKVRVGSNKRNPASGNDVSGLAWDIGVVWSPLERSRFTLDGRRRLQDGTAPTISIDGRSLALGWAHDWSQRLESKLTAAFGKDDHDRQPGTGIREDDSTTFGAVVNYQMRRWLVLGAGVSMTNRDSTMSQYDYDRKVFSLNALMSL